MTEKLPAYNNTKKILVHFKFKDDITEYQEWLTYRQFMNLNEIKCIEFCKILQRRYVKTSENGNLKIIGFSSDRKLDRK